MAPLTFVAVVLALISAAAGGVIEERSTFTACLSASKVTTLTSSSSTYNTARLAFNRRLSYKPAAIVYPTSPQQVSSVIKCASGSGIPVVARSGGHSYAAYGIGGQDGSLVVDLSKMKALSVDQSTGLAVSQTGNRLGDLAQGIWNQGKRALPHGTCPYVGTGGHTAYGGFGLFGRLAGLLLDRVVSAEVVIANGTIITASNSSHPDLFFALRGAAPSFGIVTAWTYATLPAPPVLINYSIDFPGALSATQAVQTLQAYQNFAFSNPRNELSVLCPLGISGSKINIQFTGTYYGSLTDFKAAINPLQTALPDNPTLSTKQFNWIDGLIDVTGPLSTTKAEPSDTFFAKSIVTSTPFTTAALTSWVNYIIKKGGNNGLSWFVQIDLYGGVISSIPETATSYAHRADVLNFQFYGGTPNGKGTYPSTGISFMDGLVTSLMPTPNAAYPNYIDPTLTTSQWETQYFAGNFQRLTTVKSAWDPHNVFRFPQSIPRAS